MQKTAAKIFGFLVLVLGVIGLLAGERSLMGLLNVDILLDLARIALAAILLYAVYARHELIRPGLLIFATAYIFIGVVGLISEDMFNMLPSGLTSFDIIFNLGAGLIALIIAMPNRMTERS